MTSDKRSTPPERELIRRLTSYIDGSSMANTTHWRMSKLRREAVAYLEEPELRATASPYDCGGNPTKDYPGE